MQGLVVAGFLLWVVKSGDYRAPIENLNDIHPHHDWKLKIFNYVGMGVGVLAVTGLWATQAALKRVRPAFIKAENGGGRPDLPWHITNFLRLRLGLERYLLAAGVIVGAATLATGALRQAILAVRPDLAGKFMVYDVIGYGLAFSVLIALVYAPAHAQLVRARSLLRDSIVELPEAGPESWDKWNAERKAVEELLQGHTSLFASLTGAISILTPLLGSLVSILIGKGD